MRQKPFGLWRYRISGCHPASYTTPTAAHRIETLGMLMGGMSMLRQAVLAITLLWTTLPATAAELHGLVVGIQDGDTLALLVDGQDEVRIRLAEIDTPESRQLWGSRARQALSAMAFHRAARVVTTKTDRYGRTLGRVWIEGLDINAELVWAGHAWVYRQYSQDPQLLAMEAAARQARRGLWRLPEDERQPPWEWRPQHRER
jgi:endonuclease YncB( thermonuclease family)